MQNNFYLCPIYLRIYTCGMPPVSKKNGTGSREAYPKESKRRKKQL